MYTLPRISLASCRTPACSEKRGNIRFCPVVEKYLRAPGPDILDQPRYRSLVSMREHTSPCIVSALNYLCFNLVLLPNSFALQFKFDCIEDNDLFRSHLIPGYHQ